MMPTLSLLVGLEVVTTTSNATSDDKDGIMTLSFQRTEINIA